MIFDTHIHLNDEKLYNNLDFYLKEADERGVKLFLVIGYDKKSSELAVKIANKYKNCYAAIGIIPTEHKDYDDNSIGFLRDLYNKNKEKVKAIGEIGLDYYWEDALNIKIKQKKMFIEQIELANELNLPISIHSRDSIQDTFDILKKHKVNKCGVMHCYSGSLEMAKEFIKLGYKIAFGGVLTFKNSVTSKEVLQNISLDSIVFETDAPYLAPTPYRGKLNEPKFIKNTVLYAANFLNIDSDELERIAFDNSLKVFDIKYDEN